MRAGISRLLFITILWIGIIAPAMAHASSYSISIRDIEITPDEPEVGDTLDIKVSYTIEGEDTTVKLYLYIDGDLEKTYSKSYSSEGTKYYTINYDTDDLDEDETHDIKITAKLYDEDDDLRDTDSEVEYIDFDSGDSSGTYSISTKEITVTPSTIYSGDIISVKAQFYIYAPSGTSVKVKSYLYIDGTLEKTYTGTYYSGTRYYTFTFNTDGLDKGSHDMEVRQELYRGTTYKDTDEESRTFYLNEDKGVTHDLDFTEISYTTPADSSAKVPVTVTVKNTGNTDEEDVRIKLILDSKTVTSLPFYIRSGATVTKTVYITTPAESGSFDLILTAYNADVEQKSIQKIDTKGYEISIKLTPDSGATTADWVKISGLAREDDQATTQKVSVYIDDIYEKTIIPDENGYYEDYLNFDTPGYHKVSVNLGGTTDDKIMLIEEAKESSTGTTTTGTSTVTVSDGKPYTIIIIKEGSERIYVDTGDNDTCGSCATDSTGQPQAAVDEETQKKIGELEESIRDITQKLDESDSNLDETNTRIDGIDSKIDSVDSKVESVEDKVDESKEALTQKLEELKSALRQMLEDEKAIWEQQYLEGQESEFSYVDIQTSTKELVISNYGANTLSIYITNHLGKTESFSVETDFDNNWVFLPETAIIKNKETQTLDIYFNPTGATGTYEGEITIRTSDSTIKKIPLSIYVTEYKTSSEEPEKEKEFIGPDSLGGLVLILVLFVVTMAILYINRGTGKKEKPLEPQARPFFTAPSAPQAGTFMWHDEKAEGTAQGRQESQGRYTRAMGAVRDMLKDTRETRISPKRHKDLGKVYHVSWNSVIQ